MNQFKNSLPLCFVISHPYPGCLVWRFILPSSLINTYCPVKMQISVRLLNCCINMTFPCNCLLFRIVAFLYGFQIPFQIIEVLQQKSSLMLHYLPSTQISTRLILVNEKLAGLCQMHTLLNRCFNSHQLLKASFTICSIKVQSTTTIKIRSLTCCKIFAMCFIFA